MRDEREWVPVEVTWDEDLTDGNDEIAWDATPWEDDPLFDPRPRPSYPALPPHFARAPRALDASARPVDPGQRRRDDRARPKRQKADAHLSKRKRKKLRAWEVGDDE